MVNALSISVGLNILLAAAAIFFTWKRFRFRQRLKKREFYQTYLDNPQYQEQINIQRAYCKPAGIVMLGDSHIYKARWDELLNRNDIAVRGIGSDVLTGYIHRLDQVLKVHPRIVCIEGGANDISFHQPIDSIVRRLQELTDTLTRSGIQVVLHTLPPQNGKGMEKYNADIRQLNSRIEQMALYKRIPYIDLYRLFQKDGRLNPAFAQADGTHLVGEAYKLWAIEIQKKLETIDKPVLAGR